MFRIFLLSPANSAGLRAQMLLNERAQFPLALRLRNQGAVPLSEAFTFLSGLYFRGKIAYARAFAKPPENLSGAFVITPNRGLVAAETLVSLEDLRAFARVPIDHTDARYRRPLLRETKKLCARAGEDCEAVLLGSIATAKYVEPLLGCFGERLKFPAEFVGRGDMSRGGLMLRCAADRQELEYVSVAGAIRRGARPPKLARRSDTDERSRVSLRELRVSGEPV